MRAIIAILGTIWLYNKYSPDSALMLAAMGAAIGHGFYCDLYELWRRK